jgi:hypothetical protein
MSRPKRQAVGAIGLLAAAGEGARLGWPRAGRAAAWKAATAGRHQYRPGCPGRALKGGES